MKKLTFFIGLLLALFNAGFSQVSLNDLSIPTSPAFVLMDKSPASIEKPTNPKALSISVLNLLQGGAVEFTPYWFKNRPGYTFTDYVNNAFPFIQTLAFSAASTRDETNSVSNIGAGFRTQIVRFYSKDSKKDLESARLKIVELLSTSTLNLKAIEDEAKELSNLKSKSTLNIEVAGAYLGNSANNSKLSASKAGLWLNVKYSPKVVPFDLVGVCRYSWAVGNKTNNSKDSSFWDYGINLSYQQKSFDLAFEYVNRRDLANKLNFDRVAFITNYQVSDGIVVVASFGKDFNELNNIFTAFGLKFSLSKERVNLARP